MEKMKNVFLISTDKESKLAIIDGRLLEYDPYVRFLSGTGVDGIHTQNQFIYITNYEELNILNNVKNKWFLSEYGFVIKADRIEDGYLHHTNGGSNYIHFYKEVLLTNDPSLIADGVQEISSSFLSSFAENPTEFVEISSERIDGSYCEVTDTYKYTYDVVFSQKEHQMLKDLKDYFKNTSPEKIKSDWDETKEDSPKGLEEKDILKEMEYLGMIKEFEILEGISPEQFDEKDWARFERFVKSRVEDEWISPMQKFRKKELNTGEDTAKYIDKHIVEALKQVATEKLYTEEQLFQCWKASSTADISEESMRVHFEEWKKHLKKEEKVYYCEQNDPYCCSPNCVCNTPRPENLRGK